MIYYINNISLIGNIYIYNFINKLLYIIDYIIYFIINLNILQIAKHSIQTKFNKQI